MGATSECLTPVPRRSDGKREWPLDLKARVVAETLIAGETVKGVAGRYDLIPSTVSDWRRMARQGKLVLPNLDGMGFVPVEIEEAAVPAEGPVSAGRSGTLDIVKGDVVIRLDASTPAGRIAEIVMAL
ncbi:transposase [Sulfitobacter sp.]|uniref:transposase n=1 Tax=Sulfitobacter sp. TaxID=1903071 RepID=UPI003F6B050B